MNIPLPKNRLTARRLLALMAALAAITASHQSYAATTTISYANPAVLNETAVSSTASSSSITVADGTKYAVGDIIRFYGTSATTNPFGTTATNYFVVSVSGNTITVATTPGGTALTATNTTTASTTYLGQGLLTGGNWTGGTAPNSNSTIANFGSTVANVPAYVINGGNQTVYGLTFNGGGSSDLSLLSGGNGTGYNQLIFSTNDSSTPKVTLTGSTRLISFGSTVTAQKLAVGGTQGLIFNSLAGGALSGSGLAATSTAPAKEIRLQNVDWTNFSGGITVERGELRINDAKGVLPNQTLTVGNAQTTTNNTLAVLNLSTYGSTVDGLNGTSLGRIYGASTLTVGNANGSGDFGGVIGQSWTGTTTVTHLTKVGTGTQTISGAIVGGGNVTVSNGTLLLSGSNSYTGVTTATGSGILKVGSLTALSTSVLGATTGSFTGTLDVNGFAITNAFADKSIQGGTITNTGAAVDLTGMGVIGASAARTLNTAGTGDITFGQAFTGSYTLNKSGTNTVILSGATGNSLNIGTISQGVLELAKSSGNAINGTSATISGGTLRLNGSSADQINNTTAVVVTSGTFDLNGKSETAGSLTVGDGTLLGVISGGSASTYTLNSAANSFDLRSGSVDAKLAGAGALAKSTAGSVTLSQANSYTGATTITGGSLILGAGQSLGGNLVLGAGNLNAGTFASSFGGLDLDGAGTFTLGSGSSLVFSDSSSLDWTGGSLSISGTFLDGASIRFGTTAGGLTSTQLALISVNSVTGWELNSSGFLVATAVPEPSTFAALAGLGVLGFVAMRRRRA